MKKGKRIRFGGDPKQPVDLSIMDGWNYVVRLFRPHQEILDGRCSRQKAPGSGLMRVEEAISVAVTADTGFGSEAKTS